MPNRLSQRACREAIASAVRKRPGLVSGLYFVPTGMYKSDFEGGAGLPDNWAFRWRRKVGPEDVSVFPALSPANFVWDFECSMGRGAYFYEDSLRATVAEDRGEIVGIWVAGIDARN
jgi:hypothetical protein